MYAQDQKLKTLALFDFDGTLYPHDSFTGFIFYALPKWHIIKRGIPVIPWISAYYLKLYPAHKMRPKLYKAMFKNVPNDDIQKLSRPYVKKMIERLDPNLLNQLRQHQQLNHDVALVSASIDLYLKECSEQLKIQLICSQVEIKNDVLTGRYTTLDCSLDQKKQRVLDHYAFNEYTQVYAYGNSHEDEEMLSLAQHTFMVGTDSELPKL